MNSAFERLVRFKDINGNIVYGEAPPGDNLVGQRVPVYSGGIPWDLKATDQKAEIAEVLCPLSTVPIIYGIGLNYKTHIAEAGFPTPLVPTVFSKPADALNGPYSDVRIYKECHHMDYEGEFVLVMGKDAKNIDPVNALDYVLGYTVGNDVSSRYWQMPERSGQQHGYAKSFDGFAPIGPIIVSTKAVDPDTLTIITKVNGEERQRSGLDDLLFKAGNIIAHLSRGSTLRAGTLIMTGTPSGVAAFMKPPSWLRDGNIVEVSISEIGTIRNKHVFY